MSEPTVESLEEQITNVLDKRFGEIMKASREERAHDFIDDHRIAQAMYIVVQIVLEDILPEIEIKPKWTKPRRTS